MSLEGTFLSCEGSIVYYKESIHILESGECHILYKFFFEIEEPCDIQIFLPFKMEGLIWKQENIRNREYVEKQACAKGFQKIEESIFLYDIEDLIEFKAYIPENEMMEKITEIRGFKSIHIKLSETNLEKQFFVEKSCILGLMFKITTRSFLPEKTIKKLAQGSQHWDFNIFIYPPTTLLSEEKKEKFLLIKNAEIWIILPENTIPSYTHPPIKNIIKIEKEDEKRAEQFTAGEPKLLKEGQIAVVWEIKDIKTESSISFKGGTLLIEEIKSDLREEIDKIISDLREDIDRVISENMKEFSKQINTLRKQAVTWENMTAIIAFIAAILTILGILIELLSR